MNRISLPTYILMSIFLILGDLVGLVAWLLEALNVLPGLGAALHVAVEFFDDFFVDFFLAGYLAFKNLSGLSMSGKAEKMTEETKKEIENAVSKVVGPTMVGMVVQGASAGLLPTRWAGFTVTYIRHNHAINKMEEAEEKAQTQENTVYDQTQPQSQINAPVEQTA